MEENVKFFNKPITFSDIYWEDLSKIKKWCNLPYPRHKKGCPNVKDCKFYQDDLKRILLCKKLCLAWVEFNLDDHSKKMKLIHPDWSAEQSKNLLYWQPHLRRELRIWIGEAFNPNSYVYEGAEGGGVNFYKTMENINIKLEYPKDLHIVRIIDIVGEDPVEEFY